MQSLKILEGIINRPQPLTADQRARAQRRFYDVISHFDAANTSSIRAGNRHSQLVRYTYEYSRSKLSQDTFIRTFFAFMKVDVAGEEDIEFYGEVLGDQLGQDWIYFADFELTLSFPQASFKISLLLAHSILHPINP